jgi:hypothetical protein
MCQLAEEVEINISMNEHYRLCDYKKQSYTKQQVEDLLQEKEISIKNEKDREFLVLRNNKQICTKLDVERLLQEQRKLCNKESYCEEGIIGYTWQVNEDSILNAKLNLDEN